VILVSCRAEECDGCVQINSLVVMAAWCRRYAQINSVGLRKILKKHDKLFNNRAGHAYMQVSKAHTLQPLLSLF